MRTILIFISALMIISCDDGDVLFEDFDFDNIAIQACLPETDTLTRNYTFYKIKSTTNETLSIQLSTDQEILDVGFYTGFNISSNPFEYRKFNGNVTNDYFCNDVPPASPVVTETFVATAGEFNITTFFTFDDEDGIPEEFEDINGDGNLDNDDTDGDGIPNYRDEDDDGDNIPTVDEGIDTSDPSQSRDTDSDGTPDYLDRDDDNDGVNTDQEDANGDLDPTNDGPANLPDYLNILVSVPVNPSINSFIEHEYRRVTNLEIILNDVTLSNGNQEIIYNVFDFGTYLGNQITIQETPPFN